MIKSPKISVVMSVYNVDQYLRESIDSVIAQDIGFENNVQLILVDDGSTDNSSQICREYAGQYPDNIIYKRKQNGGLASAKNTGLKYATGELVTFTDPDDLLTVNTFSEVWKYWSRNGIYINFIAIPLVLFGRQTGLHGKYVFMGERNRIIDLNAEPYNFVLSSASLFYRRSVFNKHSFNEQLTWSEDVNLNLSLYREIPRFGYVCERDVKYLYRQRFENNSLSDTSVGNADYLRQIVKILPNTSKQSPDYEKELIAYILRSALKNDNPALFESVTDYSATMKNVQSLIDCLDTNFILYRSKWLPNLKTKSLLLRYKNISLSKLFASKKLHFNEDLLILEKVTDDGKLKIYTIHNNYDCPVEVVAYDNNGTIYRPTKAEIINSSYDVKYGTIVLSQTCFSTFIFDLKKNKVLRFAFYDTDNDQLLPIRRVKLSNRSKWVLRNINCGIRYKNKLISLGGRRVKISTNRYKSSIIYNLRTIRTIWKKYHKLALYRLFAKRTKKYILVNDRPTKADDNGEALFKYINETYPQLAKTTYFVIDTSNKLDIKRLKSYGKVVKHGSFRHKVLFLNAKYILSSHNHPNFFNAFDSNSRKYYYDLIDYKFIWLQHGVTFNSVDKASNIIKVADDYIITATHDEQNELRGRKYLYDSDQIVLTGFARHDRLYNKPAKIISFMPTWRNTLSGPIDKDGRHTPIQNIEASDYYRQIKAVTTDKQLLNLLKKSDVQLNLILHAGASQYWHEFEKLTRPNVTVRRGDEVIYRDAFAKTSLLITDYSSVAFDFAYLKKPLIYFQFDEEEFYTKHYERGYFDYRKHGFGEVATTASEVIQLIEKYISSNFQLDNKYSKRIDNTFCYHDRNNCERILRAVMPERMLK